MYKECKEYCYLAMMKLFSLVACMFSMFVMKTTCTFYLYPSDTSIPSCSDHVNMFAIIPVGAKNMFIASKQWARK